jgi:2-keto-4-pentenoate hydratase
MAYERTTLDATLGSTDPERIADALVSARLGATALPRFPGRVPSDLATAYACQGAGIARWPDRIAGWKVGWIALSDQVRVGDERLVGPVFGKHLQVLPDAPGVVDVAVFAGGFGAIEAEYAFRIGKDAPADKFEWTPAEAADYVGSAHAAIEIASSPLATINQLGPCVIIADFGNNAGLLIGPALRDWSQANDRTYTCQTEIDGRLVGDGGAATLPGGPLGGLAFALGRCARNGQPLRAGQYVTTGASTGIHDIQPGESGRVSFTGLTALDVHAVPRMPA